MVRLKSVDNKKGLLYKRLVATFCPHLCPIKVAELDCSNLQGCPSIIIGCLALLPRSVQLGREDRKHLPPTAHEKETRLCSFKVYILLLPSKYRLSNPPIGFIALLPSWMKSTKE